MNNPSSILDAIHPLPAVLRESVEHGFWLHTKSRNLDPEGFADYTESTLAGMLNSRMVRVARDLLDLAEMNGVRWEFTPNKCGTEIYVDPNFAIRVKRAKANRGDRTTAYVTKRQRRMLGSTTPAMPPPGQMALPHTVPWCVSDGSDHLWLTLAFDLDAVEEAVERAWIGEERQWGWEWREMVPEADDLDVVARVSQPLADQIEAFRKMRSA